MKKRCYWCNKEIRGSVHAGSGKERCGDRIHSATDKEPR